MQRNIDQLSDVSSHSASLKRNAVAFRCRSVKSRRDANVNLNELDDTRELNCRPFSHSEKSRDKTS